jgi:hypothetical protein
MTTNQYTPLMRLASKILKYFLLVMLGFAIAYILSTAFNALPIAKILLPFVLFCFQKLGIILLCLLAAAVILESWR